MSLAALPPELYSAILTQIPDADDAQRTTLALTRALPHAPVPLEHLFARIRLAAPAAVVQLHRRLRAAPQDARLVRTLRVEAWAADAAVVANLLALLGALERLALCVGPTFAPEDLLAILERPRPRLRALSLRFRPYVQRANYYHFLKGAYFDSSLAALARWPAGALRTLSIVQDPPPPAPPGHAHRAFAQPLVFFSFQPLRALAASPALSGATALRLRVPARDVAPFLAGAAPRALPALRTLDLSTCAAGAPALARLLVRFARVRHVLLDGAPCVPDGEWAALGKSCALAGARRAREREKALRAWQEARDTGAAAHPPAAPPRRARAGRKGLATAAISLRGAAEPLPEPAPVLAPFSSSSSLPRVLAALQRIRIAPAPPSLRSLCTAAGHAAGVPLAAADAPPDARGHHALLRDEFARGWAEGVAQLRAAWLRLRTSQANGVARVMALRASDAGEGVGEDVDGGADGDANADGDGLDGLVDLAGWAPLEDGQWPCPVLCLAGEGEEGGALHVDGCGHGVAREVWGEDGLLGTV